MYLCGIVTGFASAVGIFLGPMHAAVFIAVPPVLPNCSELTALTAIYQTIYLFSQNMRASWLTVAVLRVRKLTT